MTDLEMVHAIEKWPLYPILPLKKRKMVDFLASDSHGFIVDGTSPEPTVFLGGIFGATLPTDTVVYETFEEMLEVWTVD